MSQAIYHWHEGPFNEPIECWMHVEPAPPTAFPGTGDTCRLQAMSLCGTALPLTCISAKTREQIEREARDYFKSEAQDAYDHARFAAAC